MREDLEAKAYADELGWAIHGDPEKGYLVFELRGKWLERNIGSVPGWTVHEEAVGRLKYPRTYRTLREALESEEALFRFPKGRSYFVGYNEDDAQQEALVHHGRELTEEELGKVFTALNGIDQVDEVFENLLWAIDSAVDPEGEDHGIE